MYEAYNCTKFVVLYLSYCIVLYHYLDCTPISQLLLALQMKSLATSFWMARRKKALHEKQVMAP